MESLTLNTKEVSREYKTHQEKDTMTQQALDILVPGPLHTPKFLRIL